MNFDVIIIGSGPAGCAAAITCTLQGLNTMLITGLKKTDPVACMGIQQVESIHPGVLSILSELNAGHSMDLASQGTYEGITINNELYPLGKDEAGAWQGHHINRKLFDEALLQTVIQQGSPVFQNESVEDIITQNDRVTGVITKSGSVLNGRFLIDASGQSRIAGRKCGFKNSFYSPPLVAWTGVSGNMPGGSLFLKKNSTAFIPHAAGWTWLAPELPGTCSWTRLAIKGRADFFPPAELEGSALISEIKIANRRWRVSRPVCKEGLLLCGDAAGVIDPAAGQGILNAMRSAIMAAKTVKACITYPDLEAFYLAKYDDWFLTDFRDKAQHLKELYSLHGIKIFEEAGG